MGNKSVRVIAGAMVVAGWPAGPARRAPPEIKIVLPEQPANLSPAVPSSPMSSDIEPQRRSSR